MAAGSERGAGKARWGFAMKRRVLAMVLSVITLSSCQDDKRPEPAFKPGQMVRMKAFGNEGMVVDDFLAELIAEWKSENGQ